MPHCALLTQKFCEIQDKPVEECPACQAWGWGEGAQQSSVTALEVARGGMQCCQK